MRNHVIAWTSPAPLWEGSLELTGTSTASLLLADDAPPSIRRPAILRFTNDNFMDEFLALLATEPHRLDEYRVKPETWRGIGTSVDVTPAERLFARAVQRKGLLRRSKTGSLIQDRATATTRAIPLKLFQPAHQRYYLVSTCLVCQTPGLPDRRIDPAVEEKATYLIRRLMPTGTQAADGDPDTWTEHAFVALGDGTFAWKQLGALETDRLALARGEEQLPLFPVNYTAPDERTRRLLAGLIPVGRREIYATAPKAGMASPTGPVSAASEDEATRTETAISARKALFRTKVSEPWKALVDLAFRFGKANAVDPSVESDADLTAVKKAALLAQREQLQTNSWLILADFAQYLAEYLKPVSRNLTVAASTATGVTEAERRLLTALQGTKIGTANLEAKLESSEAGSPDTVAVSLARALHNMGYDADTLASAVVTKMDGTTTSYARGGTNADWPAFLFPLADPEHLAESARPVVSLSPPLQADEDIDVDTAAVPDASVTASKTAVDKLAALVLRALPAPHGEPQPAVPLAAQLSVSGAIDFSPAWFVIRCVYERQRCGPLHDDVVSVRSERFQLAAFFDPDAPARPIRIGLPLDTSPAGLRKFDKNTVFMMSDILCGQVQRAKALTFADLIFSVLPWPLHKDLPVPEGGPCKSGGTNIGTICSLSIPIITICALILLMIMVTLLDIIFKWLPYLILCFPLPGLKAKSNPAST